MRTSCVKNGLVMVVILLFVGVAVQPSIAVNPISSDNEEDCSICPKVSKSQIVVLKSLINRAETLNNKLSVVSKLNPEFRDKYQKLYDKIIPFAEMNKELTPDSPWLDNPIICIILWILVIPLVISFVGTVLFYIIFEKITIISDIFMFTMKTIEPIMLNVIDLLIEYDCTP